MEFTSLISAKDQMLNKLPFWEKLLPEKLPEGAKILAIPPDVDFSEGVNLDLDDEKVEYFVLVGAGARVSLYEKDLKFKSVQVFLAPNAKVDYFCAEHTKIIADRCARRRAYLKKSAEINWYGAVLNQQGIEFDTQSFLEEEDAESNMNFLVFGKGQEVLDVFVQNNFLARNVRGEILVKTVGTDQSKLKITGGILINEDARGTDSYLKEDTLLLDSKARVRAMPCLEIKTNDVKAGHGATVTNVTKEDLFYLQSRGMSNQNAKMMLVKGFLESALLAANKPEYVSECLANVEL